MPVRQNKKRVARVCLGTGCISNGALEVYEALKHNVKTLGLRDVEIDFTGCHGFCQRGPIVDIEPGDIFYSGVREEDVTDILQIHFREGKLVDRLLYRDPVTEETISCSRDIPFYSKQQRIILRNCGRINPENIEAYVATGGYDGLR
ncbi:unnamed protein product, partial [marine sediment metagenome]